MFIGSTVSMLEALSGAFGPSGFEDDAVNLLRGLVSDLGRVEEDRLRNLYVYRSENTGNKPVLMLDAHSDEVGLMVQAVKPNGTLRFLELGGWNKAALPGMKVLVRNKANALIPGVIGAKPVHFMTAAEKQRTDLAVSELYIDIGASSAEEAAGVFGVGPGDPAVPDVRFYFDEAHGLFHGKAFDCRIGCAALVETLRRLKGKALPFDVVGVFSSQEEVGERGARVAVRHVRPDIALCFEGCPADDTFTEPWLSQTALHKGPMLRHMDKSVIASPRFMRFAVGLAEKEGIPVQCAVREGGGNNGAVINLAEEGVPVIVAGVPVRYIHSPNCIAAYDDLENTVRLALAITENMTETVLSSF